MGKPIDDTELCAKVADELLSQTLRAGLLSSPLKGNITVAVGCVGPGHFAAYDEALIRRIQKRFKANGATYMRDAIDRRSACLRSEQRALTKLRASLP